MRVFSDRPGARSCQCVRFSFLLTKRGNEMKRQHIASMVIVSASIFVVGVSLAAQDRYTLKSPNGISYSEFKGYETWQAIAPSQPADAGGCGSSPPPGCIKVITGNPTMIKAYQGRHSSQRQTRSRRRGARQDRMAEED